MLKFKVQEKATPEGDEEEKPDGAKARAVKWAAVPEDSSLFKAGCRITIPTDGDVQQLTWHPKGNYCAAVSPKAKASANQCIIHAIQQQKSMRPFSKMKGGSVQAAAFHPLKPHFMVATKMSVRIYDLQKQEQLKQLISGAKWIGSLTIHPSGDHVVAGSYDRRLSGGISTLERSRSKRCSTTTVLCGRLRFTLESILCWLVPRTTHPLAYSMPRSTRTS